MTLALPFCCVAAGFERDVDFERAVDLALVVFARAVGFDCAVAFDRPAGFERDDDFAERLEVLFVFGAEPLDDPLLDLLRVLLEAGLLFAIPHSSSQFGNRPPEDVATRSEQG